jgi:hypothetical protein
MERMQYHFHRSRRRVWLSDRDRKEGDSRLSPGRDLLIPQLLKCPDEPLRVQAGDIADSRRVIASFSVRPGDDPTMPATKRLFEKGYVVALIHDEYNQRECSI